MNIENVEVFGLERAIRTSGYPMVADLKNWSYDPEKRLQSATKLAKAPKGSGHDNFLKGIIVQFDMTFSLKAWPEAQRYHWLDFVSSCSTMHRIAQMNIAECCNKYVWKSTIDNLQDVANEYNKLTIEQKNSPEGKEMYLEILYNIPTGFELTAGMTTNYQQLKTIYGQRRHHRLPDWQMFCDWVETLPMSYLITEGK